MREAYPPTRAGFWNEANARPPRRGPRHASGGCVAVGGTPSGRRWRGYCPVTTPDLPLVAADGAGERPLPSLAEELAQCGEHLAAAHSLGHRGMPLHRGHASREPAWPDRSAAHAPAPTGRSGSATSGSFGFASITSTSAPGSQPKRPRKAVGAARGRHVRIKPEQRHGRVPAEAAPR